MLSYNRLSVETFCSKEKERKRLLQIPVLCYFCISSGSFDTFDFGFNHSDVISL